MLGSVMGAVLCSCMYKVFTAVYTVPSEMFLVPQARLWIATAQLAYGQGLPEGVGPFAVTGFVVSAGLAVVRAGAGRKGWVECVPSGIAIGIGKLGVI